ncbi:MAG: hypothetical protein ACR2QM_11990 [Longimicrobiales bacterium]
MKRQRTLWTLLGLTFVGFSLTGELVGQENANEEVDAEAIAQAVDEGVTLTIVNDNWADMKVYALRLGSRYRLGTVTSLTSQRFELPAHLQADISDLQLLAVPIGGTRSVVSPTVHPSAGDEVVWSLQNNLALSGTIVG